MPSKYKELLEDKEVSSWFKDVEQGSDITASVYLRRLGAFCNRHNTTPDKFVKLAKKERERLIQKTIQDMSAEGLAGSYIHNSLKSVKSWLQYNDIPLQKKFKIKGASRTPTLKNETVPSQDQLKEVLNCADVVERVCISLVAFSGVRLQVLGNFNGSNGLKIGDFPEMSIKENAVTFERVPTLVVVRDELSKTGNEYNSFLGQEGISYLKAYLESRLKNGESLDPDAPLIKPRRSNKPFIPTVAIGNIIRKPMRLAGNMNRPYVWRSYFNTQLLLAETKGVPRDYRSHFMGHVGDIEGKYSTNKRLPKHVIDKMREAYSIASEYLETSFNKDAISGLYDRFVREVGLKILVIPEEEMKGKSTDEALDLVRKEMSVFLKEADDELNTPAKSINSTPSQKQVLVAKKEIPNYLKQGYAFITWYDEEQAFMSVP